MIHANFRIPSSDYADLLKVTRGLTQSHADVTRVFRQMVFNIAAHNRDDHAKNFAFLLDREDSWTLTPAYDLTFSSGPGGEHSMSVAGEGRRPTREHCLTLAAAAGIGPEEIDIAEVHDATSFCELYQCEMLGFCDDGQGGRYVESGATRLGGAKPVNLSGGLVSKGHPVGATGLSMIHELCLQLRGEAGARQAGQPRIALAENGGGVIGFDEAACAVTILEAP